MKKTLVSVAAVGLMWGGFLWAADNGGGPPVSQTNSSPATANGSQQANDQAPAEVKAAVQEAVKLPPGSGEFFKAATAAMAGWVKTSPIEAFEWAYKQPKIDRKRHYLPLVTMRLWVVNDLPGALAYVEKTPGNPGLGCLLSAWTDQDPTSAAAWAAKQPKEKWQEAIPAVGEPWARKDPKAASGWLLSLPVDQGCYGYAITAATWTWADPAAAAEWVGKLPEGKARNDAAAMVAGVWSRKKPGDAEKIQEWARGITTPMMKDNPPAK